MKVHLYRAIILVKMGREKEGDIHFRWHDGLIDSVLDSGDGKTSETAYITISISEEYDVLRSLKLQVISQALTVAARDQFTVEDEDGNELSIYFYPEAHWDRLTKAMED